MRVVAELPFPVREIPNAFIDLADGIRLAARMWLPETDQPVPAILEYLPYRKGDGTAIDDAARHGYFAGHGFGAVRVDMRGSGDSDGVLLDEYTPTELSDAALVIDWLAAQPWCNGRVGMIGISWGGFNALQVAALAPPALRAVISVCSTDDRYADDVHYVGGGAVLARDMPGWAMTMLAFNARPPDPQVVGDRWREMWQQRLDATPAFIDRWLAHPKRDAYWRHGSVRENYAAIRAPVLVVGGWADGYTNAVLRLLDGLNSSTRAIIGPWAHHWPHMGAPGPTIGFLGEAVRWWDHWLNERDRGVLDAPRLRFWLQDHTAPQPQQWPGTWIGTDLTPGEIEGHPFSLSDGALMSAPSGDRMMRDQVTIVPRDPAHGSAAGAWCPFGPAELARDQAQDDARCLRFDSEELAEPLTLFGRPVVTLAVAHAIAGTQVVARLCEVGGDGSSLLLSWGVVVLDGRGTARLVLNALGHRLRAGHRLRLALAGSYWPVVWPAPHDSPASIRSSSCRMELPVWRGAPFPVTFGEPECARPAAYTVLRKGSFAAPNAATRRADHGRIRHANGMEVETVTVDDMRWAGAAATARFTRTIQLGRGDWQTRIDVVGEMTDAVGAFDVAVDLTAAMNDEQCAQRRWRFRFERASG